MILNLKCHRCGLYRSMFLVPCAHAVFMCECVRDKHVWDCQTSNRQNRNLNCGMLNAFYSRKRKNCIEISQTDRSPSNIDSAYFIHRRWPIEQPTTVKVRFVCKWIPNVFARTKNEFTINFILFFF